MIVARAIKPSRPFQSSIFRDEMTKAANTIRKDALADFKKTTANWKHKVTFASKVWVGGISKGIEVHVATDDPIYKYIDEGTKVRYAAMSADWKSKTEPDVVGTFPGRGKPVFVPSKRRSKHPTGRKMKPLPGIKARSFSKHIAKTTQKELSRETKNALARFTRRTGYEINK